MLFSDIFHWYLSAPIAIPLALGQVGNQPWFLALESLAQTCMSQERSF